VFISNKKKIKKNVQYAMLLFKMIVHQKYSRNCSTAKHKRCCFLGAQAWDKTPSATLSRGWNKLCRLQLPAVRVVRQNLLNLLVHLDCMKTKFWRVV